MFKIIPLFFLTVSVIAADNVRLQELQNQRFDKLCELSQRGEVIAQKNRDIQALALEAVQTMLDDKQLAEYSKDQRDAATDAEVMNFSTKISNHIERHRTVKDFLAQFFLDENGQLNIKYFTIFRYQVECVVLKKLLKEYEQCYEEVLKIEAAMELLEK